LPKGKRGVALKADATRRGQREKNTKRRGKEREFLAGARSFEADQLKGKGQGKERKVQKRGRKSRRKMGGAREGKKTPEGCQLSKKNEKRQKRPGRMELPRRGKQAAYNHQTPMGKVGEQMYSFGSVPPLQRGRVDEERSSRITYEVLGAPGGNDALEHYNGMVVNVREKNLTFRETFFQMIRSTRRSQHKEESPRRRSNDRLNGRRKPMLERRIGE